MFTLSASGLPSFVTQFQLFAAIQLATYQTFSVSFGGGVKAFFTDHFGLRFEGRYYWTQLDNWDVSCDGDECYDARDYLSQFHASVGLIFAW